MTSGVDLSSYGPERHSLALDETSGEPIPLIPLYPLSSQESSLEPTNVTEQRFEVPVNRDDQELDEIYRGERPPSLLDDVPESDVEEDKSNTTSSSSSFNVGRRLGALAAVVEIAIHRWYRGHDQRSMSSTSSSSSSSFSFPGTLGTRTTRRHRNRHYSSNVSLSTAQQERAYIARRKAREEFRLIPREFILLLPPTMSGRTQQLRRSNVPDSRVIKTKSLALVLDHLQFLLKQSAKLQKSYARSAVAREACTEGVPNFDPKGKSKQATSLAKEQLLTQKAHKEGGQPVPHEQGWWLDVASPKWEDMRKLGNILRLHPLTLEDIIHQDPREKLEFFPRLGYYFIVFRALEGARSRERFRRFMTNSSEGVSAVPSSPADEGILGAVNVYLVIFREGICTFHFEDISEHTEKLRERILRLENSIKVSTDWIAHGLLDSIVDSFFPILGSIEKEVKSIDNLVMLHPEHAEMPKTDLPSQVEIDTDAPHTLVDQQQPLESSRSSDTARVQEVEKSIRIDTPDMKSYRPRFAFPLTAARPLISFRRLKLNLQRYITQFRKKENSTKETHDHSSSSTLRTLFRIAATRRIVTSLGRLLGTKGEVLMQIRKRLLIRARDAGVNIAIRDAGDMAIYMGDVLDHIATLQHSLAHYERVLSTSHPAYLSQLRVTQFQARGNRDRSILWLSTITILVPCVQVVSGVFSMNVDVPTNNHAGNKYTYFVIIVVVSILIALGVITLTRYWEYSAKKKYRRRI